MIDADCSLFGFSGCEKEHQMAAHRFTRVLASAVALATLVSMAACGNSNSGSKGDADKAELVFWGWDSGNSMKQLIADFEKDNPGITVKFNSTGTASNTQTALTNAIAAGKGAPDVVMLEDPTVTQFAVTNDLVDLSAYGADKEADKFASGPWSKLQYNNKPYAMPIDSGPEMLFYNKAVFDKAGVDGEKIKTWDDYYEAAKKVRKTGAYMTNNSGSAMEYQPFTAQAWQAGAHPWKVDGEKITIDMTNDEGMKKYIDFQQKLIDEDLVNTQISNWSDEWNRSLNDGSLASLVIGGWMPINLMNGAPDQKGNWRVTQLPQWNEGDEVSAEDGGSALAITSQSKNQAAAYKFIQYMTLGNGAKTMSETGTFPALKSILNSDSFTDPNTESNKKTNEFFGGQNVNKILAEAAKRPVNEFQYLPYNAFAQTEFGDDISPAYGKKKTLKEAFTEYGKKLTEHGTQQGYDVTNNG